MSTPTRPQGQASQKTTLDNGLRVVTSEIPHTRSVTMSVLVGVGSRYESAEESGISHFIEHMVFKGTESRPTPEEISATVEGTGGVLNAGTEQELTGYWCKVAQPHFEECLDLLVDMLRNSVFESDSIDKERMVLVEELNMINDYPNYKVDALLDQMLWPNHPLGRDIGGTLETVARIDRQMMLEHMSRFYTPSNIVVSVAGNVAHKRVVDLLAGLCNDWHTSESNAWAPVTHVQSAPQMRLEYRRTEQTHLAIAVPGVPMEHPDRYALDLLSVILGEGMSSRLFVEVRERKGLAYDVHSGVAHFLDCGAFVVTAGVDPKRVYEAVQTILEEIGGLRNGIPEDELSKAKRLSTGRMLLRMEDTRAVSAWMGNQELLTGQILEPDDVVAGVNAVTVEEVGRVANDVLVDDKLNMAVVGPSRGQRRLERLLKL
jgi:predicted Zn-dependent peptidase